jgi:hypothetical protein
MSISWLIARQTVSFNMCFPNQMIMDVSNLNNPASMEEEHTAVEPAGIVPEPVMDMGLLSPIDRVSEILFGVIMALTFTCTFDIAKSGRTELKEMLSAALGCNIVWGLVDGIFFLLMGLTVKRRGLTILRFIKMNRDPEKARKYISAELPPVVASVLNSTELETLRQRIMRNEKASGRIAITKEELKAGGQIFLLVFLSTLPIVVPFLLMSNMRTALRVSNGIAIILMYCCGWLLGRYASRNPWTAGLIMSAVGVAMVLLAIYLGG